MFLNGGFILVVKKMANKYVDFDVIRSKIESLWNYKHIGDEDFNSGYDKAIADVLDILNNMPVAYIVEVTRRKGCGSRKDGVMSDGIKTSDKDRWA